jgi:hypothetical protein
MMMMMMMMMMIMRRRRRRKGMRVVRDGLVICQGCEKKKKKNQLSHKGDNTQ